MIYQYSGNYKAGLNRKAVFPPPTEQIFNFFLWMIVMIRCVMIIHSQLD